VLVTGVQTCALPIFIVLNVKETTTSVLGVDFDTYTLTVEREMKEADSLSVEEYDSDYNAPKDITVLRLDTDNGRKLFEQYDTMLTDNAKELYEVSKFNAEKKAEMREYYNTRSKLRKSFHEVKYNYAITVQKAQGSTFTNCVVMLAGISRWRNDNEAYALLYVAITRASERLFLL
jgi:ATP-dependent exoDNAse (exonuclease V) alpha subunit